MHQTIEGFRMPSTATVERAAATFRLLSDPTRIKLLWALQQGESSVACLAELVDSAPAAVSQHLSKLRLAGLVHGRRQGTFVYYTVADDGLGRLLAQALASDEQAATRTGGAEG